ncbi:hypothetical protein AGMMS49992_20060 [Clostridia bacterium]|nr:hypothetical protein AGMMS49992_20060 [Clostridia bacterium]
MAIEFMPENKKITINDVEYELQIVQPSWYYEQVDRFGISGHSQRNTSGYMDALFRHVVVSPAEVRNKGMKYFDDRYDFETPLRLIKQIESFLLGRKRSSTGESGGEAE